MGGKGTVMNSYSDITQYLIGTTRYSAFVLVDGLQYELYYGEELQPQPGVVIPFFSTWPDSRIAFAGPWLIHLSADMSQYQKLRQLESALPSVSWIASELSSGDLVAHLQRFLNVSLPGGKTGLLRFWDPRVAKRLALMLDEQQHEDLLKNVEDWLYTVNGNTHSLKWRAAP